VSLDPLQEREYKTKKHRRFFVAQEDKKQVRAASIVSSVCHTEVASG
jgi:hypothetical protein